MPEDHLPHFHPNSINPALEGVGFCPRCGESAEVEFPRRLTCPHCDYGIYFNPKPVSSAIPRTPAGEILLLRRGFAPGKNRWTFPGGFVDLGESVEQAAVREAMEEIRVDISIRRLVGLYSRPDDRVILVVYAADAHGVPQTTPEATEIRAFAPADIPWDELAFWSTEQALRDYLAADA